MKIWVRSERLLTIVISEIDARQLYSQRRCIEAYIADKFYKMLKRALDSEKAICDINGESDE